ncbi:ABC transporter permease [Nonomuraea ferruginea]
MIPLIRAELLKARASRTTRVLVAVTPLFCALWACLPALMPAASDAVRMANVYNMAQQAYVFTMIIGILGMCGEFRHGTITWSFLASPRRGRVVLAKLAVYGLVGLAVSALSALATLVAGGGAPVVAGASRAELRRAVGADRRGAGQHPVRAARGRARRADPPPGGRDRPGLPAVHVR